MPDIILLFDPSVACTPMEECGEPLADLRTEALERLVEAQRRLPDGVRCLVAEGFGPPDCSAVTTRSTRRSCAPHTQARVREVTSAYIAPPDVAPHVSGGAMDLTLCSDDGAELPPFRRAYWLYAARAGQPLAEGPLAAATAVSKPPATASDWTSR